MEPVVITIFSGLGLITFFTVLFILAIKESRLEKAAKSSPTPPPDEPQIAEFHARVIDRMCRVRTVGTRLPRTVTEFYVYFEDDSGETYKIPVPEEYYDAFEKEQGGILKLLDGSLFSFEPDT